MIAADLIWQEIPNWPWWQSALIMLGLYSAGVVISTLILGFIDLEWDSYGPPLWKKARTPFVLALIWPIALPPIILAFSVKMLFF